MAGLDLPGKQLLLQMRVPAFGEGSGVEAKPPVVAPREAANRVYVCFSAASRRTRLNRNPSQMSGTTDHFKPSIVANGVLSTVGNYFCPAGADSAATQAGGLCYSWLEFLKYCSRI